MSAAALLLAIALLVAGRPSRVAANARTSASVRTRVADGSDDPLALASSLDLFAACVSSGMTVAGAARATAPHAPTSLGNVLCHAADLLGLGADPVTAWSRSGPPTDDGTEALCRLARRSAASGTALAQAVCELADQSREAAADASRAAAERASVLVAGPLGACYLPAFVCLGIIPVVTGLAADVLQSGVW
jgi:pilus assembly protein TadC